MLHLPISDAAVRIAPYIRRTPVLRLAADDLGLGVPITLKLELLQHAGSFKPRGAFNRMLTAHIPAAGVVAASGGNHGVAVAYAAKCLGVKAEIFTPTTSDPAKLARIRSFGASLTCVGGTYAEAYQASRARRAVTRAFEVHAYDDTEVVAGQGTLGYELAEDVPELTHIIVSLGGGGLISGIAACYAGRTNVIAVEPEQCPTLHAALQAGRPVPVKVGGVAADSLGASQLGQIGFPIIVQNVTATVLVPDSAIRAAQRLLWERVRLVAEPGGATALAALICGAYRPDPASHIGVVVCGRNTDPGTLPVEPGYA